VQKLASYRNKGYRAQDVEVYDVDGEKKYAVVFRVNTDQRDWRLFHDMSIEEFEQKFDYYNNNSGRLIDQEVYVDDGTPYYSAIWFENIEEMESESFHDMSVIEFNQQFANHKLEFIPMDFESYVINGVRKYAMAWKRNAKFLNWKFLPEQTQEEFNADYAVLKSNYRLLDVEIYMKGQNKYITSIWVQNKNGRKWQAKTNLNSQQFTNKWYRMNDAGYRMDNFIPYINENGLRYGGIWRQNTDRPDWELKNEIDDLVVDFWEDWNLPSVSVGIAVDGKIVYMRGVGEADVKNKKAAHSRSVYRLASISKAVGGVLTMKLMEKNPDFLLEDFAKWDWLNSLPDGHDYTVGQLLSNRSGIGEYSQFGSDTDNPGFDAHFDSAWDASQFILSESLDNRIGEYEYSTHAYTVLGAVLEQVELKNIFDIVEDELTVPYGLSSLGQEFRDEYKAHRVKIYENGDKDSEEPPADKVETDRNDITWKTLGGGLESSVWDLLRFGMKLNNEEIISAESIDTMWTDPTPGSTDNDKANGNYYYGWNVGQYDSNDGNSYTKASKAGGALGASTYLRVVPEKGITMVVLTNRRFPHRASSLVVDIEQVLRTKY
jgi:CubicO group peptidase (beta-lactamase class C family)